MITFGGQLLLDRGDEACHVCPGVISVENDRIVKVDLAASPADCDVGGDDYWVLPGLIDAHLHLPQFDIIGAHGCPLLRWLDEVVFPAEIRWNDVGYATEMTRRVAEQLLGVGTTSVAAYATSHPGSTAAAIEVLKSIGIGGCVGMVGMDRAGPPELLRSADEFFDTSASLIDRFPPDGRMSAAITPRFAVSCTEALLDAAGRLAHQSGAILQTHLAETVAECERVASQFGGRDYLEVYHQTGLLGRTSVLGHAIHLSDAHRAVLAETGTTIAHCPTANSFLRSGAMDRALHRKAGVRVVLGSDIGAGYERSMVRVARAMIETASSLRPAGGDSESGWPTAATAWHTITAAAADALGWTSVGRIKVGKTADLVLCRPDAWGRTEAVDSLSQLMFAWDDRWIEQVWLAGHRRWSARN